MSGQQAPADLTRDTGEASPGVGSSLRRPDGDLKVRGQFAFSSDLSAPDMLWGHTVRSPHPYARIVRIDTRRARRADGVVAVLTAADVPGRNGFGLVVSDQPVLASDVVRYVGDPVALVAAETPEAARLAAALVEVEYAELEPVLSLEAALAPGAPYLHPDGNLVRAIDIRRGDVDRHAADAVVRGTYTVGMQDQAPLGTESGLAIPDADGGVHLLVNSQWIHADRNQLAAVLDLPPARIDVTLAGVGGAFGAREDITLHAHLCLLALATRRPVKMVYSREESFLGHVHRHPAVLRYEHGAAADGRLLYVRCSIDLDGGAYASTSWAVVSNAAAFAVGPYVCEDVDIRARVAYTNNPPCGAMRGFGAVQAAIGHEAQMDRLADALGMDPIELRLRNVLDEGDLMPTGQPLRGRLPARAILESLRDLPPVADRTDDGFGPMSGGLLRVPGGVGNVTHGEGIRRGVGYGIGFKAGGMPEGIRDYSTARVRLFPIGGEVVAQVQTSAAEIGQGVNTIAVQIVQTELGVADVMVLPANTSVGSAGSSSASRQTYMTGGAVQAACRALRERLIDLAHERYGHRADSLLEHGHEVVLRDGALLAGPEQHVARLTDLVPDDGLEEVRRFDHRATTPYGVDGQGEPHIQFIFAGHRAVADVDVETGLTQLVQLDVVQDVGRALNPVAVEGQMHGGTAQGVGLALMEEIQVSGGRIRNASFTDYLIPTVLDIPPMTTTILEIPDPEAPYGVKGAGEPATISSTPAVVNALRRASGRDLSHVPVRPWDLIAVEQS
ncbi:xanthine dehydrogenase subunit D [Nocardioides soli]|uniref:Xanthine dehydrogenase D subunit n=1 Tax=Nocardioides soli TaxID=1036020 RepID=A0A7W4W0S9_9ACTN|nr:xanthine dehydrogenase D subunit [Nocardioides soli]